MYLGIQDNSVTLTTIEEHENTQNQLELENFNVQQRQLIFD